MARRVIFLAISLGVVAVLGWAQVVAIGTPQTLQGVVSLVWGDPPTGGGEAQGPFAVLTTDRGETYQLVLETTVEVRVGGLLSLLGRRIEVKGVAAGWGNRPGVQPILVVQDVRMLEPGEPMAVTGAKPWVSVLCKFSDVTAEPKALSYFQSMYGSSFPELDHYWKRLSYYLITVKGSGAYGWYTLPHPRSYYITGSPEVANLGALADDCTAVADPYVYFPTYTGINLMFNALLDGFAWGGSRSMTLDGVTRTWSMTWEPPWGYQSISTMDHEMGHGFGWPHSSGNYGQTYDNDWDVMSNSWLCNPRDDLYDCYGQHTITYHLDRAGWIPPHKKVTVASGDAATVVLEPLSAPESARPLMLSATISGTTHFLALEARKRAGYDVQLAGDAVIIHDVDTTRQRPAYLVDVDGNGDTGDEGAMFRVGESYTQNGIYAHVDAAAAAGFQVSVANNTTPQSGLSLAISGGNSNGMWEPGEQVSLQPTWLNFGASATASLTASAVGGTGVTVNDASATYGAIAAYASRSCTAAGDCYTVTSSTGGASTHRDVTFTETLSNGRSKAWKIHLGGSFADVGSSYWAGPYIERVYHFGITAGCLAVPFSYCPGNSITRAEMAVMLIKGRHGPGYTPPAATGTVFSDVPAGYWAAAWIEQLLVEGITSGCAVGQFCPGNPITRAEMAVMLLVTKHGAGYQPPAATGTRFADVPASHWAAAWIEQLAAEGITAGCSPTEYCPGSPVTRAEMAVFLSNIFRLELVS
jgi:M6 family metalloprotease-like protein